MLTIIAPIILGCILYPLLLAVHLISVFGSSATRASTQLNSGGDLDNAYKIAEVCLCGDKGTDIHTAEVIGDTFGDLLKIIADTSLHILVKY